MLISKNNINAEKIKDDLKKSEKHNLKIWKEKVFGSILSLDYSDFEIKELYNPNFLLKNINKKINFYQEKTFNCKFHKLKVYYIFVCQVIIDNSIVFYIKLNEIPKTPLWYQKIKKKNLTLHIKKLKKIILLILKNKKNTVFFNYFLTKENNVIENENLLSKFIYNLKFYYYIRFNWRNLLKMNMFLKNVSNQYNYINYFVFLDILEHKKMLIDKVEIVEQLKNFEIKSLKKINKLKVELKNEKKLNLELKLKDKTFQNNQKLM